MGIRNISKSLAGVEDLLLDNQTHTQTRNGSSVDITGIHAGELPYYPSGTGAVERTIGEKLGEVVSVKDFGAVGDGSTDDSAAIQSAIDYCVLNQACLFFPEGAYYCSDRLIFDSSCDVRSDATASIRWDSTTDSEVGILLDFEGSEDTLAVMEFPQLFGPAIASNNTIPGYSTNTQDGSTRTGTAIDIKGSNRIDVRAQIVNGFENGFLLRSTASSTCDNVNIWCNTSDFCEKFVHLDSTAGFGLAQPVIEVNTVWAKFPLYVSSTTGYINGLRFTVTGTAFSNEFGGCGVYTEGTGLRSSTIDFNQIQVGWRNDSPTDTAMLLTPTGTMAATPVAGETITQATTGATGVVVTNTDYTLSTTKPFTVKDVTGTFTGTYELTGSTSGALGAGSVPFSVRGVVGPWIGGDQTSNSKTYDVEQSGTVGYFGGTNCDFTFGVPANHPALSTGACSVFPKAGESVRIRNAGVGNSIVTKYLKVQPADSAYAAITLSTSSGESNFNGGEGACGYAKDLYVSATMSSLAAGANANFYFYHSGISSADSLHPMTFKSRNEGLNNDNLEVVVYKDDASNNRQCRVKIFNRGTTAYTGTKYFFLSL